AQRERGDIRAGGESLRAEGPFGLRCGFDGASCVGRRAADCVRSAPATRSEGAAADTLKRLPAKRGRTPFQGGRSIGNAVDCAEGRAYKERNARNNLVRLTCNEPNASREGRLVACEGRSEA